MEKILTVQEVTALRPGVRCEIHPVGFALFDGLKNEVASKRGSPVPESTEEEKQIPRRLAVNTPAGFY